MTRFISVLILFLSTALSSFAQEFPRTEVFAGYSFIRMRISPSSHQNFNGWNGSLAFNPSRWVGVVAEVSGHYSADNFSNYSFMVGPRFTYRTDSRLTPFAHALAGVAREGEPTFSLNGPVGSTHRTGIAYAFGGGLDAALTERISVRVIQLDYFDQDAVFYRNGPRISTGFVFRF